MSDFPYGGNIADTRSWLDKKAFKGMLVGWEADALLGLEKTDIISIIPGENGLRLWGYLNTARLGIISFVYWINILYIFVAKGFESNEE